MRMEQLQQNEKGIWEHHLEWLKNVFNKTF